MPPFVNPAPLAPWPFVCGIVSAIVSDITEVSAKMEASLLQSDVNSGLRRRVGQERREGEYKEGGEGRVAWRKSKASHASLFITS